MYVAGNKADGGYIRTFGLDTETEREWHLFPDFRLTGLPRIAGYAETWHIRDPDTWPSIAEGIFFILESTNEIVQYNRFLDTYTMVPPVPGPREIVAIVGEPLLGSPVILTHNEGGGASIVALDAELEYHLLWESAQREMLAPIWYSGWQFTTPVPDFLLFHGVPEPSTLTILAIAGTLFLAARKLRRHAMSS